MSDTAAEADFDRAGRGVWYLFLASVAISTLSGILLFLPPWQVYATDRYRLFWIVILVGVAGWSFLSGGRVRLGKLCAAGLTAFSVLGLISALQAPLPRYALLEWAHFIGSALLGLGVFQYVRQNKMQAFKGLNQAVFFAVYTYTLFYLLWYFTQVRCEQLFCVQLQLPAFNNPRTFDTLFQPLLLLYPLTINHLPDRRPIRWAYWILGAIWFSLLFVSSGRANFLVILLICPMIFVVAPSVGLPWIKRLGVFLLFGGIAYVLLHGVWPYLTGAFVEPGPRSRLFSLAGYGREELWYRAWIIFLEHPIMGGGPMHFSYDVEIPLAINAHPHNLALQILSEWGIFCALLFFANVFFLLSKVLRCLSLFRNGVAGINGIAILEILAAWIAMLLAAQISGTNMLILAGLSGSLAGMIDFSNEEACFSRLEMLGQAVLSVMVVVFLLNSIYPEAGCRKEEAMAYLKEHPREEIAPRFWSQGKIAFSQRYLPQCYKDAKKNFMYLGGER